MVPCNYATQITTSDVGHETHDMMILFNLKRV